MIKLETCQTCLKSNCSSSLCPKSKNLNEERLKTKELTQEKAGQKNYAESEKETNAQPYVTDERCRRALALLDEIERKNKETVDGINETLKNARTALDKVQETSDACDKFKEDFNRVMAAFSEQVVKQLAPVHRRKPKPGHEDMIPKVSTVSDVLNEINDKSHIVVLTVNSLKGAGISAASNIPTFRGEGGYWTLRNKQEKLAATEFLTHNYFEKDPEEIWRWHHEFKKLAMKNSPNISHFAIANLQAFCKQNNINFTLITQNIDGYHVAAYEKTLKKIQEPILKPANTNQKQPFEEKKASNVKVNPKNMPQKVIQQKKETNIKSVVVEEEKVSVPLDDIYEIHGNIHYMRCDKNCASKLIPSPKVGIEDTFVPKCSNCQGIARPHTLFFDEPYQEEYYRGTSIFSKISSMDCLIVVGTALETNLAAQIVARAIANKKLIVEINPQPCIENGIVRHLIGGSENFIPSLCEGIIKKRKTTCPEFPMKFMKS